MRAVNWAYIDRVETKVTPPMHDAIIAVSQLMGVSVSEFLRQAILEEIWDQYPGIARELEYAEANAKYRGGLEEEIERQLQIKENYARLEADPEDVPY